MHALKTLRRPANWQDFETLCKKLWGEIWRCPEIKKNGRCGQEQHGIDIYGMPFGENEYYGIQCKGKDEYTDKQLSEDEITKEIEKAKQFQPPLKKLYFATTAVKDAKIEEFVRKKNSEHRASGRFEVHIFSWEDIVELIDENKETHSWYVKSQNFKTNKSVSVTFNDGSSEFFLCPQFQRVITIYKQKIILSDSYYTNPLSHLLQPSPRLESSFGKGQVNLSFGEFSFAIANTGTDPIEEYKLFFEFDGEILDLSETNEKRSSIDIVSNPKGYRSNVVLWKDPMSGQSVPKHPILVGDDVFYSDKIFLKPSPKDYEIGIKWKLISRDLKDEGELKLFIRPSIKRKSIEVLVEDPLLAGKIEKSGIEEVIIEK